jgi:hypothetical protein
MEVHAAVGGLLHADLDVLSIGKVSLVGAGLPRSPMGWSMAAGWPSQPVVIVAYMP